MRSFTKSFKRLKCDVCKTATLTSVAKTSADEYALALPPDWRLLWNKSEVELKFCCDVCWETIALTLDQDDGQA